MSTFDPEALLEQETTEALESEFTPIPEDVYQGMIIDNQGKRNQEFGIKEVRIKSGPREGEVAYVLEAPIQLDAPGNELAHGRIVKYSAFLDLDENTGALETGTNKNVRLGALREAVGQNKAGQSWKFRDLVGQLLMVKIKTDPEGKYSNIDEVASI